MEYSGCADELSTRSRLDKRPRLPATPHMVNNKMDVIEQNENKQNLLCVLAPNAPV